MELLSDKPAVFKEPLELVLDPMLVVSLSPLHSDNVSSFRLACCSCLVRS